MGPCDVCLDFLTQEQALLIKVTRLHDSHLSQIRSGCPRVVQRPDRLRPRTTPQGCGMLSDLEPAQGPLSGRWVQARLELSAVSQRVSHLEVTGLKREP